MKQTIVEFLNRLEKTYADQIAFSVPQSANTFRVTYSDFVSDVKRFASVLRSEYPDVAAEKIGLFAKNSYAYVVAFFGVCLSGGIAVPLNVEETKESLLEQIAFLDLKCLFTDEPLFKAVFDAKEELPCDVRWLDGYWDRCETEFQSSDKGIDEPMMMMFTSGTTSTGKCVMHSQRSFFSCITSCLLPEYSGRVLQISPLFHIAGLYYLTSWLQEGCTIVLNTSLRYLFRDLPVEGCEQTFAVPRVLEYLAKDLIRHGRQNVGDLKAVFSAGAPLRSGTIRTLSEYGIRVIQAYGLTESGGHATTNRSEDPGKLLSVGNHDEGIEISIQNGEICLKGPNVMLGYYQNPEATAAALQDGWLHTGDIGHLDEDGYLYITGRLKNLIILSNGENISPERIEALLLKNSAVTEVIVKGKDEQVCAEIFCEESRRSEVSAWVDEVNRHLAFDQHVTLIEFRSAPFPKTASGKILRKNLL